MSTQLTTTEPCNNRGTVKVTELGYTRTEHVFDCDAPGTARRPGDPHTPYCPAHAQLPTWTAR